MTDPVSAEAQASGGKRLEETDGVSLDDAINESMELAISGGETTRVETHKAKEPDGDEAPAGGPKEEEPTPPPEGEAGPDGGETPPEPEAVEIPGSLSAEHQTALKALPEDARKAAVDFYKSVQSDTDRRNQEVIDKTRFADEIEQIAGPYRSQLAAQGMTVSQGIAQLVQLNEMFKRDPAGYLNMVAQNVRQARPDVDLSSIISPQEDLEDIDPRVAQLTQTVNTLANSFNQFQQTAQQSEVTQVSNTIQEFADAKNAEGQPAHPHFNEVRVRMGALMETGAAKDMEDAYQQAMRSDPAQFEAQVEARVQAAQEGIRKKQEEEVQRARGGREISTEAPPAKTNYRDQKLDAIIGGTLDEAGIQR